MPDDSDYRKKAKGKLYAFGMREGDVEVDEGDDSVARGDDGAFVKAWVWVSNSDLDNET